MAAVLAGGVQAPLVVLDDRRLRRAGLDYWDKVLLARFHRYADYLAEFPNARRLLFSAAASRSLYDTRIGPGDHLVFGSETRGLNPAILAGGSGEPVAIPMRAERRGLNLATACGIAVYEALRQALAASA